MDRAVGQVKYLLGPVLGTGNKINRHRIDPSHFVIRFIEGWLSFRWKPLFKRNACKIVMARS